MKREVKYVHSHRPYAVDLDSMEIEHHPAKDDGKWRSVEFWYVTVEAVWFRGRKAAPVAVAGNLWGHVHAEPRDGHHVLELLDDGRYGGNAHARWDGENLWAPMMPFAEANEYLDILKPMLDAFPEHPGEPYDPSWWVY